MVPEIRSTTDRTYCHFGLFFALLLPYGPRKLEFWKHENNVWRYHFTHAYHKWQSYDVWLLRYAVRRTKFFVILDRFLPFYPLNNPKNQNFAKIKKTPGGIIILHMCKWQSYNEWFLRDGAQQTDFFVILDNFLPFTPLTTQKIKILKK